MKKASQAADFPPFSVQNHARRKMQIYGEIFAGLRIFAYFCGGKK